MQYPENDRKDLGRSIRVWDWESGRELVSIREPGPMAWGLTGRLWLEGDRLLLHSDDGTLVFDGTPE